MAVYKVKSRRLLRIAYGNENAMVVNMAFVHIIARRKERSK